MAIRDVNTVLLVENEPLIALDIEGMLLSAGIADVHHVMSSDEALRWLDRARPELTILDVWVKDGPSTAVADRLRLLKLPFVVHSGHSQRGSPYGASFAGAAWLSKPCTRADLEQAIDDALGRTL